GAPAVGGVLRATVLRPVPRVSSRPGLAHRATRGGYHLDGDGLVHRGWHLRLLRLARPRGHAGRAGGAYPRQPVSAAAAYHAHGRVPEDWVWNATLSGAPQGGVVSPI